MKSIITIAAALLLTASSSHRTEGPFTKSIPIMKT